MGGHLVKRSVSLRGHRTSLALEPAFWSALDAAALAEGLPLAALIARIDDARTGTGAPLSSAVRVWLLRDAQRGSFDLTARGASDGAGP